MLKQGITWSFWQQACKRLCKQTLKCIIYKILQNLDNTDYFPDDMHTVVYKCNFVHGCFRCHLPVETVNVEVKIISMQGIHMFRRDRMCQIIKCNPWCTRLHPHPTLIKKMRIYLELEGKLGPKPKQKTQPQQNWSRPTEPSTNPLVRRGTKTSDKRRKLIPAKRYKVQVVAKPVPTPKASNMTMQTPKTIPITMINLEKGKLQGNSPQGGSSAGNPSPLEDIPTQAGTPWPRAGSASGSLFESRKDWPIPPTATSTPTIKVETEPHEAAIPHAAMTPKQIEKCGWGTNCPICKK